MIADARTRAPAALMDSSTALVTSPTALRTFQRLNSAGIRYAVWKGSVRLQDNLKGVGDLDLVVAPEDLAAFRETLGGLGWRRTTSLRPAADGVSEDHFLLDDPTGRLVHLDLALQLEPVRHGLGGVPTSWQRLVLEGRTLTASGVAVAAPAVEAALLLLRIARMAAPCGWLEPPSGAGVVGGRLDELSELLLRCDTAAVEVVLGRALTPRTVAVAVAALRAPSRRNLRRLHRQIGRERARTGTGSPMVPAVARAGRRLLRHVNSTYLHRPVLLRRGFPGGGRIVALVGGDGSGKSSLARQLEVVYGIKFDTLRLYLGSGDGPASLLRFPMKLVHDRLPVRKRPPRTTGARRAAPDAAHVAWALALAREKRLRLRRARLARARGLLVLCDRYPQSQVIGENDGPLLTSWSQSSRAWCRWLAAHERRPYDQAERLPPDLVLKLEVDPATAVHRRPDASVDHLAHRAALVRSLRWDPGTTRVVVLDATAPPTEVLRRASSAIWASTPQERHAAPDRSAPGGWR
jgi:thymidylate kinase